MSNFVIECKNKTALISQPDQPNGQFTTNIQEKIMLEEGDSVVMKSAFIDTKASSNQKIIIPLDLTLEMTFVPYLMNTFQKDLQTIKSSSDSIKINDGLPYVLCKRHTTSSNNFRVLKGVVFAPKNTSISGTWGGFIATLNYTNLEGNPATETKTIPSFTLPQQQESYMVTFTSVFDKTQTTTITAPDGTVLAASANGIYNNTYIEGANGVDWPNSRFFSNGIDAADTYVAQKFSRTLTIEGGNYSPAELCEAFNREAEKVQLGDGLTFPTNMTNNNFLQTVQVPPATDTGIFVNTTPTRTDTMGSAEGMKYDYKFQYGTNPAPPLPAFNAVICGASNVTLNWEEDTQRFEFEYLHMPYYYSNQESVGYFEAQTNGQGAAVTHLDTITRNSGVYLTELTAIDSEGSPTNFWDNTLGFDTRTRLPNGDVNQDGILFQYAHEINFDVDDGSRPLCFKPSQIFTPTVGKQFSANYQGIDTVVTKADPSASLNGFHFISAVGSAGNPGKFLLSTSEKTTPIEAGKNILQASEAASFGYFVIEVQSNFMTNLINEDSNSRNTMGIVGRFYIKDSYTSAGEEASLLYTHTGEPMVLSSFNIRIKDSDRKLAQNIGKDSTIFLNIIKAPPKK